MIINLFSTQIRKCRNRSILISVQKTKVEGHNNIYFDSTFMQVPLQKLY